jgi:hypothetical protein
LAHTLNFGVQNISEIYVIFKESQFFPFILKQQFTVLDFVAYTGGALGLFLGFSVVSFAEIVYYFNFRPISDCKRKNKIRSENQTPKTKKSAALGFLFEFFDHSSIHGMNQIVMKRRIFIERCFWLCKVGQI